MYAVQVTREMENVKARTQLTETLKPLRYTCQDLFIINQFFIAERNNIGKKRSGVYDETEMYESKMYKDK